MSFLLKRNIISAKCFCKCSKVKSISSLNCLSFRNGNIEKNRKNKNSNFNNKSGETLFVRLMSFSSHIIRSSQAVQQCTCLLDFSKLLYRLKYLLKCVQRVFISLILIFKLNFVCVVIEYKLFNGA